ncbi:MAG: DUF6220 domain-containing protein [Candidatus Dormibacteraeota bacterium]|nr:DUF6220 domain-containing protein [Candidatus Dormibacteraeota bacterium]
MLARLYLAAAWLFAVLIPVQFYFAAAGSFSNLGFSPHMWLGLGLHGLSVVLIVIALVGRLPRRAIEWGVLQFILISAQVGLARLQFPGSTISAEPQFVRDMVSSIMVPIHNAFGNGSGIIASLHGIVALGIAAGAVLTIRYARQLPQLAAEGALHTSPVER